MEDLSGSFASSKLSEGENPLRRSHRSNAMYPKTKVEPIQPLKKAKTLKQSKGLNQSTYVRSDATLNQIQQDIATGNSTLGQS